ncbi:HAD hydrolase-like protein [Corynebacterium sp. YIM 101645]|uniref:HAD hydrolase-like protein n=1 Tax=Corynebacterium lemuris TaxID=1859292 RepID=A0ABT2FZU9_9CORY|nr:HAD hydrolase-like protein [Corynebacterium lemuris]
MSILLLDVDGTLIDSLPGIQGGFRHTLDQLGWPHPDQQFIDHIAGPPMEVTLRSLGMSPELAREGLQIYLDYTRRGGWANATTFPGMLELVRAWKAAGLTLATATSKGEEFARLILEREGFLEHIDFLGAAQEDGPRRGKSAVIDHVLATNGWDVDTSDILMVGDRTHDIEGAAEHGINTVAVAWGYGTPAEWATAARTAHTPEDLKGIVHDWLAARG